MPGAWPWWGVTLTMTTLATGTPPAACATAAMKRLWMSLTLFRKSVMLPVMVTVAETCWVYRQLYPARHRQPSLLVAPYRTKKKKINKICHIWGLNPGPSAISG